MFKTTVTLFISALLLSGTATAAPLDITDIVGGWANPAGGLNVAITNVADQGTDIIRWGDGVTPDSGYNFTPGPDILAVPLNTNVLLGTLVHVNEPIPSGSSITSVDYGIGFSTNGNPASLTTILKFDHNETPNGANPCADGGANGVGVNANGCADIVTVMAATLNSSIDVGGEIFFFNLRGFTLDGGSTFSSQFKSAEEGSNSVQLFGIVGQRRVVPEPATLALFAFGLAGFGFVRRRRNA